MTTIVTRTGKGSPLTTAEVDANFTNLNTDKAEVASPTFTGSVNAPTPIVDNNTTLVPTTAWFMGQVAATNPVMAGAVSQGTALRWARADHVHPIDTSRAPIASPTFTGTVTIPAGASISGYAPLASPTFTGTVTIPAGANISGFAPLASPTFTGTPAAPTTTVGDNSTKLATTAWFFGQVSATSPAMDGVASAGAATTWSRGDHVHPTDTSRAPINAPSFTGGITVSGRAYTVPIGIAYAASVTLDCTQTNMFYLNPLAGAITINTSNQANGQSIMVRVPQDGTGGRTVSVTGGLIAGSPSLTAGKISLLSIYWNGGNWEGSWTQLP